ASAPRRAARGRGTSRHRGARDAPGRGRSRPRTRLPSRASTRSPARGAARAARARARNARERAGRRHPGESPDSSCRDTTRYIVICPESVETAGRPLVWPLHLAPAKIARYARARMRTPYLTAAVAFAALLAPFAAGAAPKPFTGPAGWNHTVTATPSPTSPRSAESWQKGDQNVSALNSTDVVYGDVVAAVHKSMAGNNVHPTVDRDITCAGKPAHELEMTLNGT